MSDAVMKTTELAGNIAATDMSILSLIGHADIVVKLVMLLLLAASFWTWAIIFDKMIKFRGLNARTEKFEKVFWSGQLLDQLYERVKTRADHPLAIVFVAAMSEWSRKNQVSGAHHLHVGIKERIFQAMQVAGNREIDNLGENLGFLATIGSAAPFIGLFGTVWGIMNSFQSIAAAKNTTLAVVAPGIAEALLATAVGLFAAIPAVIFYNYLSGKLNQLSNKVEDFSSELGGLLSRELDEGQK
jgi:biopolymer transport protein TolQ